MKMLTLAAAALLAASSPSTANETNFPAIGEIMVSTGRGNVGYNRQSPDRPMVGLRRVADGAVIPIMIFSDTRDAKIREQEIYTVIQSALDRAAASGVELVRNDGEIVSVTKANYKKLYIGSGGKIDTGRVDLLAKVKLAGSTEAAIEQVEKFVKAVPHSGRGLMERMGGLSLTIVNPDQYRDKIVAAIAEASRRDIAAFGPDYAAQISGIDGQVMWTQASSTEVFLYLPYRYVIVPK